MRLAWLTGCTILVSVGCSDTPVDAGSEGSTSSDVATSTGENVSSSTSAGTSADSSSSTTRSDEISSSGDTTSSSTSGAETTAGSDANFEVGFDVTEISPNQGHLALNVYMGSYGPPYARGPAESVHDALYVRSIGVGLEGEGFVAAMTISPAWGTTSRERSACGSQRTRGCRPSTC